MDLVDEEHVIAVEPGEQGRQVAGAFQHRAGGLLQVHAHLGGDDVRQRGLAQPRRAEQQHVVQRLLAPSAGLDEDVELLADLALAHVVGQSARAQRLFQLLFLHGNRGGVDQAVVFDGHGVFLSRRVPAASGPGGCRR